MKSMIKRASTAVRRFAAYYEMRSIEINLAGAIDTLPYVRDAHTRESMALSIKAMSLELCRARGKWIATLPPGKRCTWQVA